jgi:hypothetical protein
MVVYWNAEAFVLTAMLVEILEGGIVGFFSKLNLLLIVKEFSLKGVNCVGIYVIGKIRYLF